MRYKAFLIIHDSMFKDSAVVMKSKLDPEATLVNNHLGQWHGAISRRIGTRLPALKHGPMQSYEYPGGTVIILREDHEMFNIDFLLGILTKPSNKYLMKRTVLGALNNLAKSQA